MYDHRLSEMVLKTLLYAPIFYLAMGYWMASNKQILSNDYLFPLDTVRSTPVTGHVYTEVFDWLTAPAWPLLLLAFAAMFLKVFGGMIAAVITRLIPGLKITDIVLDEDIDNYWASLDEHDRKWSIAEEKNNRSLCSGL